MMHVLPFCVSLQTFVDSRLCESDVFSSVSAAQFAHLLFCVTKNVLFNDALNTFYLRLYGVIYVAKDHSDSEKETRCRHIGYFSD